MTEIGYVYSLKSPSGKYYIGQTWYIDKRFQNYKNKKCKSQIKLFHALNKYGFQNFDVEIVDICYDQEELDDCEIYWINFYNSDKLGYNCRGGGLGGKNSEIMKIKIREKAKCRFSDPNERLKASIKNKKAWKDGKFWGIQNIEFYIDDILYKSIKDASEKLNIAHKTIHNRLNSKNIKYSNYRYKDITFIPNRRLPISCKAIQIDEKIYNTIEDAVKDGYSRMTIYRALKGISTRIFKNKIVKFI